jgi:hypothetical protein
MKTLTRYIPEGYTEYKPELGYPKDMFAVYLNLKDKDFPRGMFFTGKKAKPTWYYTFRTTDEMKKTINDSISRLMSWQDMKDERKIKRQEYKDNLFKDLRVGDLFSNSWGYDQTNVDFYQVTEIKGKTFTIREIGSKRCGEAPSGSDSDYCIAVKDSFTVNSAPVIKRSLSMEFGSLTKTNETEKHFVSWYA